MHQAANALLAVPFLVAAIFGALLRRLGDAARSASPSAWPSSSASVSSRRAGRPTTAATAPVPILPLTQADFETTVATDRALTEPVTIPFTAPMDPASVAAAADRRTRRPPVDLAGTPTDTSLTIAPADHWSRWRPAHRHGPGRAPSTGPGNHCARPARAVFLTRGATTGSVVATEHARHARLVDDRLHRDLRPARRRGPRSETAIRLDPPTPGIVRSSSPTEAQARYTFQPADAVAPGRRLPPRRVRRSRRRRRARSHDPTRRSGPRPGAGDRPLPTGRRGRADVARDARPVGPLQPGDGSSQHRTGVQRSTAAGKLVAGTVHWAEHDTVLVFTPSAALPGREARSS